jgi:exopolysaccharide biosynthesis polyprenyl glycosylphosphotransferase
MSAFESITSRLYADAPALALHESPRDRRILRNGVLAVEAAGDFFSVACGFLGAAGLDGLLRNVHHSQYQIGLLSISAGLLAILLLHHEDAYRSGASLLHIRETERSIRVPTQVLLCLLPLSGLFERSAISVFIWAWLLIPTLFLLQKRTLFVLLHILQRSEPGALRIVIYGTGSTTRRVISSLLHSVRHRLYPVAIIEEEPLSQSRALFQLGYSRTHSVPISSAPISASLLKSWRCQLLLIDTLNLSPRRLAAAQYAARQAGVALAFLSGAELESKGWSKLIDLDGMLVSCSLPASNDWLYSHLKRALDVFIASLLLISLAPLLLLIGALIRLDSHGPALFVQDRVGRDGKAFSIYKFRSMFVEAPHYQRSPLSSLDPRITRIGRLLRRFSLDELPQLMNVLIGNMSLVGPRPEMPFIVQEYNAEQRHRLQVKPGITGLWQLSADRAHPIHESMQYDLYYICNRNLFMDLAILIHTLFFALRGGV